MAETLYGDAGPMVNKIVNDMLRDHIAHVLGPSPFDFRGRHLLSKNQARKFADDIVDEMEKHPERENEFLEAVYGYGRDDD